jgi:hypothetical protein
MFKRVLLAMVLCAGAVFTSGKALTRDELLLGLNQAWETRNYPRIEALFS